MEKITLRKGDYVLTEGLSEETANEIAIAFTKAGVENCGLTYDDLGEILGWDIRDDTLYTSSSSDYFHNNVFTGRCLTPEQALGTNTSKWKGNGLPPVGEVCEYNDIDNGWVPTQILAHHPDGTCAWHESVDGDAFSEGRSYSTDSAGQFRPIKTDQERAVESIMNILQGNIFDRGWSLEDTAKEIYTFLQKESLT